MSKQPSPAASVGAYRATARILVSILAGEPDHDVIARIITREYAPLVEDMRKIHTLAFGSGSDEADMDRALDQIRAIAYRHAFPKASTLSQSGGAL